MQLCTVWSVFFLGFLDIATAQGKVPLYPINGIVSPASDDGSSPLISLQQCFIYFGREYCQLYVNQNGHLTFERPWGSYTPKKFPMYGPKDIIAPFWTDLDNRKIGRVIYNQYTKGPVLQQATNDINNYFSLFNFVASWVFIATWDGVAYYPNFGDGSTVQVVLISNGQFTFLLMNYEAIYPTNNNVQAGFDTVGSTHYFSIPGSFTPKATGSDSTFCLNSNVNVPGRWAFYINQTSNRDYVKPLSPGVFWTDSTCTTKCNYTGYDFSCHNESCAFSQVCKSVNDFQFTCQLTEKGTCHISGDPHYTMFDGKEHHFQGPCTYVLSQQCGSELPYYRVEGSNEHRDNPTTTWTRLVKIFVYNETIELVKGHRGQAKVSGVFTTTPFFLVAGDVHVYTSGFSVVVSTVFGLEVSYDADHYVKIKVPFTYKGATCGLCGNFNNDPNDDFQTPDGQIVSAVDFGNSWQVLSAEEPECEDGCEGLDCGHCPEDKKALFSNPDHCGILQDRSGPFAACHQVLSPRSYVENCLYDLCLEGGQEHILCEALNVYASQCQESGITIPGWRRPGLCEIHCPANSHFEPQGTACPATCVNPDFPRGCAHASLESCICNDGYVLSGADCVPLHECGCNFEGRYYHSGQTVIMGQDCSRVCDCISGHMTCQSHECGPHEQCNVLNGERGCYGHTCFSSGVSIQLGGSFWTDSTCTKKCTCTTSGLSCHNETCAFSQVCDSLNDFQFTCQLTQKGTCHISGDPHYTMFDGKRHHFQGPCTYVLSQQCGSELPYYRVEGSNEHRDNPTTTWTRLVKIFVYNETIELVKGHRGQAKVSGVFTTTPFFLVAGDVHVYTSGFSVVVSTVFGLEVSYDADHYVKIKVPFTYKGATCGLCGNFNNDPNDDFQTPDGQIVSAVDFGNSWQVLSAEEPECEDGCEGLDCGHCPEDKKALFSNPDHCGILQDRSGPFAACHQVLSPRSYVENCLYDLCLEGGQEHILCEALNVYASQCQESGITIPGWRRPGLCEIHCPANSHFEPQGTACPATCVNPDFPRGCAHASLESCICNDGYVLSGADCVPLHKCGCNFEGRYYHSGQTVIMGQDCSRVCDCISGHMTCQSHECGPHEQCNVLNGERGCYGHTCFSSGVSILLGGSFWTDSTCTKKCTCTTSGLSCHNETCAFSQVCDSLNDFQFTCQLTQKATCHISGDPHYTMFDGKQHHFQGPCTYVLSQQCGSELPYYRVEGSNEHRDNPTTTWTRLVKIFVYNETIELVKGHRGQAKVSGVFTTTPFFLVAGDVHVYTSGFSVVVSTVFGLEVSYDANHYVKIKVPFTYKGATCGLCGNFNNDPNDDFQTPDGQIVSAVDFGNSWQVLSAEEPECEDGCEGLDCGHCPEDKKALFSNPDHCGILQDRSGPFAACHQVLSPRSYVENCLYDLCLEGGQEHILCEALHVYASQCQESGITIPGWRRPGLCEIHCPANSHFESQGTACPATCVNPDFPRGCANASLESCICNDGYVLSGADCVPLHECGCNFEGRYYHSGQTVILGQDCSRVCDCISGHMTCQSHECGPHEQCNVLNGERGCYGHTCSSSGVSIQLGGSFWTDSTCTKKCTCTTSGLSCHNETCAFSQVCDSLNDFQFTCQLTQKATCHISGDPHYTMFDGKQHHFQGPCTYVLSQQCGSELPYYRVEGSNEHRGNPTTTWTRLVKIFVYNETIELVKGHRGQAKVSGVFTTTPFFLVAGDVHVYTSGFSVVVSTVFGLEVSYDANHYVKIKVPFTYKGATCGLCGNFNNDPNDDFQTPDGQIVSAVDFGNSWQVLSAEEPECEDGCEGLDCGHCPEDKKALFSNPDHCGILQDRSGPFAACHQVLSPRSYVENCLYDLCLEGGQEHILCEALHVYASQCQESGITIPGWRRPGLCEIHCPANSHFESQGTACPATCVNPDFPRGCANASLESCICNDGYVLSGADCVPLHECGCNFEGRYYHSGQTVILGQDCSRVCDCISGHMTCQSHECGPHEQCNVLNGERGCYGHTCSSSGVSIQLGGSFWTDSTCTKKCTCTTSGLSCHNETCAFSQVCDSLNDFQFTCQLTQKATCHISGDPHYTMFDGKQHHFQGPCTYVLSQQCGSELPYYRVEGSNEHRGNPTTTWTRLVKIFVYNETIELVKGHRGQAKVSGVFTTTPFFLVAGDVHVYTSGFSVVVSTVFGLEVSYDANHYVKIKVPFTYKGATCGLCGNFNNDPNDDFQTPDGQIVSAVDFGNSWQVLSAEEPECEDGCEGLDCGHCPEDKKALFSNPDHCGILQDRSGPFAACHQVLSPRSYVENCLYDLCLEGGQEHILCEALHVYASQCQESGITIPGWRRPGLCEIHCPANSHFESQGTACPATCVNPDFPRGCANASLESCICNDGYVLSGADCVPLHECGCNFEGRYYHSGQTVILGQDCSRVCDCISGHMTCQSHECGPHEQCNVLNGERGCYGHTCSSSGVSIQLGGSFWTDSTCTKKCTCTTSGLSCHNETCAFSQVCDSLNDFQFTCQLTQKATCHISGDPHYTMFDGKQHHFQGPCTYVLSQQCGSELPYYRVEGSNEHRGNPTTTWTRLVKIFVYNETIELVKGHRGQAKVSGVFTTTPFFLVAGDVHVYTSGFSVVVSTVFGLEVSYDANHYVKIKVPFTYKGATCGLCGNFNNDPNDDFQTPDGQIVSAVDFGNSWQVLSAEEPECEDGCEGLDCGHCPEDKKALFSNPDHCGILQDRSGPFAACHQVLSPRSYVENCLYDLCLEGGQEHILCEALHVYASQCQESGITIPGWRRPGLCEIHCPANSHFESQGTACPATCVNPDFPRGCANASLESCICNDGYVLSGADCVPLHECGCNFEGRYYHSGQTVILGQDCSRVCDCISGHMTCQSHECGPHEQCNVLNGERGCYGHTCSSSGVSIQLGGSFWTDSTCTKKCTCTTSGLSCHNETCAFSQVCDSLNDFQFTCQLTQKATCHISGDPHYTMFDGKQHHFQGPCTYVLSQQCGSELPYYRVEGSNEHRGNPTTTWTRLVKIFVYNETIELVKGHRGQAKVSGVFTTTPFFLVAGDVHVYTSGFSVVVSTVFGLEVSYDANHYVKIKVPFTYKGATCGLCGNFNNDPNDDFQTPDGQIVSAVDFGNSWQVLSAEEPECEDGCEGLDCGHCPEDKKALFSNPDHCGILQDRSGPFAACHQVLSPRSYVENCLYDLCLEGGQEHILCEALHVYASQCQESGITIPGWRRPGLCEIHCPANSHFESQGTACPATCVNPDFPRGCANASLESCICNDGYVLSGADCVPLHECGCNFEGRYYHSGQTVILGQDCSRVCDCISGHMTCQSHECGPHEQCNVLNGERGCYGHTCSSSGVSIQLGGSFWTDSTCTKKCTCTTSGLSCHNETCAFSQVCDSLNDFQFTCQLTQKATCHISGDPHYTMFDGKQHHFQGPCTYVLSQQCGSELPYYRVEGSNEHRGNPTTTWTRLVKIFVYNETIELVKGHRGQAKVSGVFTTTPFFLVAGDVHVYTSGFSVVVSTVFGLEVSYDANHYVKIKVPFTYKGATCGLCGNFNNDPNDDFQTPDGQIVSAVDFGNSWQVLSAEEPECEDGCEGLDCGHCPEDKKALFSNPDHCGILQDRSGPFAACHQVLSPRSYVENCLYDLCLEGGQEHILCEALHVYASQCQESGITIPGWRRPGLCEIHCPANSHFESQGTACPATCVNPDFPRGCANASLESCICNDGYVLSGADCVPLHECGCNFEGRYYHSGQTVILGQDCSRVCDCISGHMTCQSHECGPHEQCNVLNGERGCYGHTCSSSGVSIQLGGSFWTDSTCTKKCTCTTSGLSCHNETCAFSQVCDSLNDFQFTCQLTQKATCHISGDPHYTMFDGKQHHFQGPCTYVLSQQCGSELPYYRVEGSNEHRGNPTTTWTRLVKIFVYNETIELVKGHRGQAKVSGVFTTTPFFLVAGDVHVYTSGFSVVVSTVFGLEVSYDANHYVKIKVPFTYKGATCGLCGNFNNDPNDDFQTPDGQIVSAVDFGNSWQVLSAEEPECEDGCEGLDCGHCPEDKKALFSNPDHCGILQDRSGPFAACHQVLSPRSYVENCLYDLCLEGGQEHILCEALHVYASQCQESGITIPGWRRPGLCEIHCPANSHFESQGTACPATCVNPDFPRGCANASLESCICNDGYVLSGADCVPLHECGCNFEGRYYHSGQTVILGQDCSRVCDCISGHMTCQSHECGPHEQCNVLNGERGCYGHTCSSSGVSIQLGGSFWTDSTCTKKCTCTTSGLSCHNETCAFSQVCDSLNDFQFTCQLTQKATCHISGDPHYTMFDGKQHHFQGPCTYVLSQQCGSELPYYRVEGSNEHRGNPTTTWTRLVKIFVYNETIELVKGHRGQAKVSGVFTTTPFFLVAGDVHVYTSGFSVVVSTVFGLEVSYDANHYVKIKVPFTYKGATCGLCGNFNNDPNDDFQTPDGQIVSAVDFGNSWQVLSAEEPECEDGCEGLDCGHCPEDKKALFSNPDHCGILQDRSGPFAACHQVLSPRSYVENCLYDLCLEGGQEHILCEALHVYASQCQESGITIPGWRRPGLCEIHCPANSHFESQGTACPATCVNPDFPRGCANASLESCICNDGYVLSGADCVPLHECGCNFEGRYYHSGQTVILGQDCSRVCDCISGHMTCQSHECGPHEQCNVLNGERGCYGHTCSSSGVSIQLGGSFWTDSTCTKKCTCTTSGLSCHNETCAFSQVCDSLNDFQFTCQLTQKATCHISGDPHYTMFDGKQHHFQGPCTYVLSQQCGSELPYYRVEGSNEHRGNPTTTWTRLVKIFVYNETIEFVKGHRGQAKVSGVFTTTPFFLVAGDVHVYTSGFSVVVSTVFGLEVSYDANHYVKIKVPFTYKGATCGLCGNFNNDPNDDFQTPDGQIVSAVDFGNSWQVLSAEEPECEDGCEGLDCGHCPEDKKALFSNPDHCGILQDRSGPFAACHQVLSPRSYVENCLYDLCLEGGQEHILCEALHVYASQCQESGITIPGWRRPGLCEIHCPANSHFESQGTACPATCVNPDFPRGCANASLESCICNDGYVLSGADCVPLHECGCNFEGRYYHSGQTVILGQDCSRVCDCISGHMTCQSHECGPHEQCNVLNGERGCYGHTCSSSGVSIQLGGSFWTDSTCTKKCTCTTSGLSCHNETCAFSQVCDSLNDFQFTCQLTQKATCHISGDPHYTMFDGKQHHFQGPCTYVLSQQCGSELPYYRVEGSNEHRGNPTTTWTRLVKIFVYNETIELVKGHRGQAKVSGVFTTTPFFLVAGDVHVYTSGFSVVVSTVFGLEVSYDANHYVKIKVPFTYKGATCGLCGNFNNDPNDDFQTPDGQIVSAVDFGNSWQVLSAEEPECEDGCEGLDCGHCPEDKKALFSNPDHCGILQDRSGPFAACHQVLSPRSYVENCLYDLCLEGGQEHILCEALHVYASQCQESGITIPGWRRPGLCEIHCPANSHFESQGTACPATCVNPDFPRGCANASLESCICNDGYVLSGADCVPLHECGCNFEGRYYHSGQTVILGQDCSRVCDCISGHMTCQSHECGPHEQCNVLNGERGCYGHTCSSSGVSIQLGGSFWTDSTCTKKCTCTTSGLSCHNETCAFSQVCDSLNDFQFTCQLTQKATCHISGDPHYTMFDGKQHHFQGPCTYVLSQQCGSELPYYRVEGSNEHRGNPTTTWTRLVKIFVYNETIELVKGHRGQAKVSGVFTTTPFFLVAGDVHVYTSGFSVVVSTVFGLEVSYDANHYVKIKVPFTYKGATCGLCGNFNNDPNDDFQTPDGQIVSAVDFGNSWQVLSAEEPECEDGCEGLDCGHCPEDKKALFSNPDHCGILQDRTGPFAACHQVLSPRSYVENCLYDLCLEGGQEHILCEALHVYASQCQESGITIPGWRRPGLCEIHCPANSHFESQGTACPATCVNPDFPRGCANASLESCICNDGYVLSGADCVPLHECGCNFEGRYYHSGQTVILGQDCSRVCDCISGHMTCQSHECGPHEQCNVLNGERGCYGHTCSSSGVSIQLGGSFWTDSTCTKKCTCTTSGLSCHNETCAFSQVCDSLNDFQFTCQLTQKATCHISGDPHYTMFDGKQHHFQGPCTYVLSQQCGSELPYYRVEGSNEHRGNPTTTWTRLVKIFVYNETIELVKGHRGQAKVSGVFTTTPFFLVAGDVHVYTSGFSVVVSTVFGLEVSYDANHYVKIKVPFTYKGATCGLCGNFNNDPNDDFQTPDGQIVSAVDFGNSWQVLSAEEPECEDGCEGLDCGHCPEDKKALFSNPDHCGILQDRSGPFAACHQVLSPRSYVENCLYDLCLEGGQEHILCEALHVYASQCQESGITIPGWRRPGLCEIHCPANSHFESQGTACPATCVNPDFPRGCAHASLESCICNDGYVLSGADCVPLHECGCNFEGRYYHSGQTVILGQDCSRVCDCISGHMTCQSHECGPHEQCNVLNGERRCRLKHNHGTCYGSGDPHYFTFDGRLYDFQGTCRYVLAMLCIHTTELIDFSVEVKNEALPGLTVSVTSEIYVNIWGIDIHLLRQQNGKVKVNGIWKNLPILLHGRAVSIFVRGQHMIVDTEFGLHVSYDGSKVSIKVPSTYSEKMCGLCGNFNGNPNDDFQTPSGLSVTSPSDFGASWNTAGNNTCSDGCGSSCPQCTDDHAARAQCDIIRAAEGPFSLCHQHLDPVAYFNDCVFDVCIGGTELLCSSIQAYVSSCQSADVLIYPWRHNTTCYMLCPTNSHYELCGKDCGRTCASSINVTCEHVCSEGCFCDEGFVRSGIKCVPEDKCGCQYNGFYYYAGESFWTEGCSEHCECTANNNLSCIARKCSPQEECSLSDGHLGCHGEIDPCSELECTDNEWCGEKEGIYGCFCNENANQNSDNFDSSITCVSSSGTVSLSRCLLFEAGFHPSALHLRDVSCKGSLQSGRLVFHFNNDNQLCGTILKSNGSHFIYENVILGNDSLDTELYFSCVFPLTAALSMDVAINPVESAIKKILPSGKGHYRMRLTPYKDAGFQYPLSSSDIEVHQNERLFIEVQGQDIDERQISTVMDTCWATPINKAHYPLRQDLISQGCPADASVKIIQNGNSTLARFSFETFTFNNFSSIYLHCHIHLCLMDINDCVVHCNVRTRSRRDISYYDSVVLSLGLLVP